MNTRILAISDIHANYEALKTLKPVAAECDLVLCAGDVIGYYCQVNEVCDLIRSWNPICVRGNHDEYLLRGCPAAIPEAVRFGIEFADREIDADHRMWIRSLPLVWGGTIENMSILLAHGSPFRPLEEYLYENKIAAAGLEAFDFDLLVFGHTHRPFLQRTSRPVILNPGSVGQSRSTPGHVCGAIIQVQTREVTLFNNPYNMGDLISMARKNGAGDWITKHLTPSGS